VYSFYRRKFPFFGQEKKSPFLKMKNDEIRIVFEIPPRREEMQ
jgi:hypothetical protein